LSIVIIGANGNMATRYKCILNEYGVDFIGFDTEAKQEHIKAACAMSDGVIICTPTDTHLDYLDMLCGMGVPVLCEKPLTKDVKELEKRLPIWRSKKFDLTMIMQYEMLSCSESDHMTYYNYFKHGNDGLAWDCIQIISLASGEIELRESSPVWQCCINGHWLNIKDMDHAYIKFIRKWLEGDIVQDLQELYDIHKITYDIQEAFDEKPQGLI